MFVRGVVVRSGAGRLWSGREWMDFGRGKVGKVAGEDVALRPLALVPRGSSFAGALSLDLLGHLDVGARPHVDLKHRGEGVSKKKEEREPRGEKTSDESERERESE